MRINSNGANAYTGIGTIAILAALSGSLGFKYTISILGTGAILFLWGCTKNSANHSITGANRAVTLGSTMLFMVFLMGCVYYHHEVNQWYVCGAFEGRMNEKCLEKLKYGMYKVTDEWIDAKYFNTPNDRTNSWKNPDPVANAFGRKSLLKILSYFAMAISLGAISLPGVINILGSK